MQRTQFPGINLETSRLGLGCMRLPMAGDKVNDAEAIAMIRKAIDNGVTYIDTAYGYHDGYSERITGMALQDGYREKVILATKLPVWLVKTYEDMERLLDEQLKKLQTDYVDFYLLHALSIKSYREMKGLNVSGFLDEMVKKGKIKYPAFSFHDNYEAFIEILNDYPWKMAQVQMNFMDTENQATLKGIYAAKDKGVGIVVMEPLRGGALARTPENVKALYDAFPIKYTPVQWALRYLYDMPEVTVVLSGMSNEQQVMENIETFADARCNCLSAEERALFKAVEKAYNSRIKTGCTGCNYCQPCPQNIRIPHIFRGYDQALMFDTMDEFKRGYANANKDGKRECVECGACEAACPQNLPIIQYLKDIDREQA